MNGETPLLLSSGKVEHYSAAFYLRNPLADGLPQDSLAIVRERRVADDMHDRIVVQNVSTAPVSFELAARGGERLRGHLCRQGARLLLRRPDRRQAAARPGRAASRRDGALVLVDRGAGRRDARRSSSPSSARSTAASSATGSSSARASAGSSPRRRPIARRERPRARVAAPLRRGAAVCDSLPPGSCRPAAGGDVGSRSQHSFERSVADLASLRMRGGSAGHRAAAGRRHAVVHDRLRARHADHLVPDAPARARARPRRARGARRAAGDRGRPVDRRRAGEDRPRGPARQGGRRRGSGATTGRSTRPRSTSSCSPRCGAGRATTSSSARLREPALARARLDRRYGDRDGDGFVDYERRTERGLENQSWKDSGDSQRFADGRIARAADRAVRGAGLRLRREAPAWPSSRARSGASRSSPSGSRREAAELQRALRRGLLGRERGGYYALALDGDEAARSTRSARTSATCSGAGSSRTSASTRSSPR